MVHEKVNDTPLPAEGLQFEGSTYDLGWDGHRRTVAVDTSSLPTSDFAVFLINAVKFHCGRLFHLFDETLFMHYFTRFYEDPGNEANYPRLWFIHFLLILAFGKAFIVGANKSKRPPGAELFVQGMQLLPDITGLYTDPVQSTEVLCCAALYLQCLDLRSAAYNVVSLVRCQTKSCAEKDRSDKPSDSQSSKVSTLICKVYIYQMLWWRDAARSGGQCTFWTVI